MAFCKVCACGAKITFEKRLSFPDYCPSCGRRTTEFLTYPEEDPMVQELMDKARKSQRKESAGRDHSTPQRRRYVLRFENGEEIPIPDEGGIVGRTGIGAEQLSGCESVSRQHLKVTPRRNIGLLIEDLSSFGTFVDGQRIEKHTPVRVPLHGKITLCNVELTLEAEEM